MTSTQSQPYLPLNKKIRNLYNKRSAFAHGGLEKKKSNEELQIDDYNLILKILKFTVTTLIFLRNKKGITHVKKRNPVMDENSLDGFFENWKYSWSIH